MDSEFYALELSCEAAQDMPCAATQDITIIQRDGGQLLDIQT